MAHKRAILACDLQLEILAGILELDSLVVKENATKALTLAAQEGIPVIYTRTAFRPGYPECSPSNMVLMSKETTGILTI